MKTYQKKFFFSNSQLTDEALIFKYFLRKHPVFDWYAPLWRLMLRHTIFNFTFLFEYIHTYTYIYVKATHIHNGYGKWYIIPNGIYCTTTKAVKTTKQNHQQHGRMSFNVNENERRPRIQNKAGSIQMDGPNEHHLDIWMDDWFYVWARKDRWLGFCYIYFFFSISDVSLLRTNCTAKKPFFFFKLRARVGFLKVYIQKEEER